MTPSEGGPRHGRAVRINRAGEEAALFAYTSAAELKRLGAERHPSRVDTYV